MCFLQTCVVSALNFSPCTGMEGTSVLEGPDVSENVALLCSAQHEALVCLANGVFFPCSVCYKIQTQGGSSEMWISCIMCTKTLFLNVNNQVTGTGGPFGTSNIQEHHLPFDLSIFKSLHQIEVWLRYFLFIQVLNPSSAAYVLILITVSLYLVLEIESNL